MTTIPRVNYGTSEIEYSIKRSDYRNSVDVAVDPKEGVIVTCPSETPEVDIENVVLKKAPWVLRKMKKVSEVAVEPPEREYVSGESFLYLGRHYRLKVIEDQFPDSSEVKLKGGRFWIHVPPISDEHSQQEIIQDALKSWFRRKAERKLKERAERYAPKIGVTIKGIVVKNQMKRWGSCTKGGVLHVNYRVAMAPMSVIDYVIVHELAHLKFPKHSNRFWKEIRKLLPDYERRKDWLRIHGPELSI